MVNHSKLSKDLRATIQAMLAGSHTREQLNSFVAVCHTLARAFIDSKSTTGTLRTIYDLNSSDLAYDCIAELFHQDERGCYLQLQSYFGGIPVTTAQDEEMLAHVRRLVFSKVNQGIFRMYSESDPSLAKILRNIKLAVHSLQNFIEIERFGETCIAPSLCDTLEHLPQPDRSELEQRFSPITKGTEFIPELLAKLSIYLREQHEHSRIIPLVSVGLLFRSAYTRGTDSTLITESTEGEIAKADSISIIRQACCETRNHIAPKYVGSGKIPEELFATYFQVVEESIIEKFVGRNGHDGSLFEQLQMHIPSLSKKDYAQKHRNKVEYFLKMAEKETRKSLKHDL
jgi:hypothetical protein